ncbi:ANTAR domain-containing response regulator [Tardiphaga sp.]|jgi:AmiR/NasT family two-component response regulator|uniref:ANTAR domain-containing response regulator n=1 Tax=Tardiphaga sp. TaxID=1926292 RepID=UPI00348381DC
MIEPRLLQNFNGNRALVVTDRASAMDTLVTALERLGVAVAAGNIVGSVGDIDLTTLSAERDVIFIDGDMGDGAALPLTPVGQLPPAPVIGVIGVTAPSRLKALMRAGATSFLRKPIHASAVYPALFVGVNEYRRHRHLEALLEDQERRRRGRRDVVKAIIRVMAVHGLDDDGAYDLLRRRCMAARQTMEEYCSALVREQDLVADDTCCGPDVARQERRAK